MDHQPLVSIGMPVYNGADYIRSAVDSILNQTLVDFELIISDNASEDETGDICRNYASQDSRIRYSRNEKNLGAAANYNRVASLARGSFFKWAAHDDVLAPTYLERCVGLLQADPTVVLCHARTQLIDERGERIINPRPQDLDPPRELDSVSPTRRFAQIVLWTRWCFEVFGVVRTEEFRRTSGHGHYYGSDKVFLAELALMGRIAEVPEALFLRRYHPRQTSCLSARQKEAWIDPRRADRLVFPRLRCFRGYFAATMGTELSVWQRMECVATVMRWAVQRRRWRDWIGGAVSPLLRRTVAEAEGGTA